MITYIIRFILEPPFIRRWDNYLIINHPIIWYSGLVRFIYLVCLLNAAFTIPLRLIPGNSPFLLIRDVLLFVIIWGTLAGKPDDIYFKILRRRDILSLYLINVGIIFSGLAITILAQDYLFFNNIHAHLYMEVLHLYLTSSMFISMLSILSVQKYYNTISFTDWGILLFFGLQCIILLIPILYASNAPDAIPVEIIRKFFLDNKMFIDDNASCHLFSFFLCGIFIFFYIFDNNFLKSVGTIIIVSVPFAIPNTAFIVGYFIVAQFLLFYFLIAKRILALNSSPTDK